MKKNLISFVALAMCAATVVSCSDDDKAPVIPAFNGTTLTGSAATDIRLESGKEYSLQGAFFVKAPATLTIEPGVKIVAKEDNVIDYIVVEQGAKIVANGTAANPIIMTAETKSHGKWGGLHICGKATINLTGGSGKSEVGEANYGGNDDADCSGSLDYVVVEYAGQALDNSGEKEGNGFTFYGVGSGTKLSNLVAYKGSDDGYEWFGGTASGENLVSIDNQDDSFDCTYGWRGTITNAYVKQLAAHCDHMFEGDNQKNNDSATPTSHPTFKNATFVGINKSGSERGIKIRRGCLITLDNVVINGKTESLYVESDESIAYVNANASSFTKVKIDGTVTSKKDTDSTADLKVPAGISTAAAATGCDMTKFDWAKNYLN